MIMRTLAFLITFSSSILIFIYSIITVLSVAYLTPLCGGIFGTNTSELNVMNIPPNKIERLIGPIKIAVPDVLEPHDFYNDVPECDLGKKYLHVDPAIKDYLVLMIFGVIFFIFLLLGISIFATNQISTQNELYSNFLIKFCKITVIPFSIFGAVFVFISVFISIKTVSPLSRLFSRYVFLNFHMTHVHMLVTDDKLAILDVMKRMFIAVNTFLLVTLNLLQSLLVISVSLLMFVIAKTKETTIVDEIEEKDRKSNLDEKLAYRTEKLSRARSKKGAAPKRVVFEKRSRLRVN